MKLKDNENFVVLGIFLGLTGILSALILAVFSTLTAKPIAEAKAARENRALRQVLPEFDNDINAKVVKVKRATSITLIFIFILIHLLS